MWQGPFFARLLFLNDKAYISFTGAYPKQNRYAGGQDPESQAGRQTVRRLWWMAFGVETEVYGKRGRIRIGFVDLSSIGNHWLPDFCLVR